MTPASSSMMPEKTGYQVFLSYGGTDVRQGLADCLHHVMAEIGLRVFIGMDEDEEDEKSEEEMERDTLDDDILQVINDCRIYVPIFSKYYASNERCLQELAHIVRSSESTVDKMIFPIFYDVTLDDFHKLAMDFVHKEENFSSPAAQMQKEALLHRVEILKGWEVKDTGYIEFSKSFTREALIKFNAKVIENINGMSEGLSAASVTSGEEVKEIQPEVLLDYSYDVFFSFRGLDTRQPFADFLSKSMKKADICFFSDDPVLITLEDVEKRQHAINNSELCVPILSKTYASNLWCLLELHKMVQSGKKIIPVFYGVEPSDARLESEVLLRVHRENLPSEIVSQWKRVLQHVAQIKGWEFKDDRALEFSRYFAEEIFVNLPETQDDQANRAAVAGKEADYLGSSSNDYEVFLSFRGADTREELADHLYQHLVDAGIRVYRNDEKLPIVRKTDTFSQVIKTSKICIPIFSTTYASSKWCLRELVRMVEYGKEILPVFYDVEPSDVKLDSDAYQPAKDVFSQEEVRKWKDALGNVTNIKGWKLDRKSSLGDLPLIAREVLLSLKAAKNFAADHLVGIDGDSGPLKDVLKMLDVEALDVQFVGICGMQGIGKTTLAKVVFNQLCDRFDCCTFLANVKTSSETMGLPYLRAQLISDLLGDRVKNSHRAGEISITIAEKELLRQEKVLIVLDDVDREEQIRELLGDFRHRFGLGSRVILTSRDHNVLANTDTTRRPKMYTMDELSSDKALKLFKVHATMDELSSDKALELLLKHDFAKDVLFYVGGLPLAVEIVGSFLSRRSSELWLHTREKLLIAKHLELEEILKICYEELEDKAKQIFLDIACFFADSEKTNAFYMWEACDLLPNKGIKALLSMSLIKITKDNRFWMHDLVRKFGREIVLQESLTDPTKRSRVWRNGEASSILKSTKGQAEGENKSKIWSYLGERAKAMFHFACVPKSSYEKEDTRGGIATLEALRVRGGDGKLGDEKPEVQSNIRGKAKVKAPRVPGCNEELTVGDLEVLSNLRFLEMSQVDKDVHEISCLPANLKWLSWRSSEVDLTTFKSDNSLVVLDLSRSKWMSSTPSDFEELKCLKVLDLSYCGNLTRLPPLSRFKSLERLVLEGCERLAEIDSSIGSLLSLKYLNIRECYCLRGLPEELSSLTNLTEIVMKGNGGPFRVPEAIGKLKSLTILEITNVQISSGLPESIGELKRLKKLSLFRCCGMDVLPKSLGRLKSLVELDISHTHIIELPESFGNLKELRQIKMESCSITCVPFAFGSMEKLEELYAKECTRLRELPESIGKLSCLRILDLSGTGIRGLPKAINHLSFLDTLRLQRCHDLQEIPELPASLKRLYFTSSGMRRVPNLSKLHSLTDLVLRNAIPLTSLKSLEAADITSLDASDHPEQSELQFSSEDSIGLLPKLETLKFGIQSTISMPPKLGILPNLRTLVLSCPDLQFCPQFPSSLSKLVLRFLSPQTKQLHLSNLQNLLYLEFDKCEMTEDILGSLELDKISSLELLYIKGCSFKSFHGLHLPHNLRILGMDHNVSLIELPQLQGLHNLRQLSLSDCPNVSCVEGLGQLASLQELTIRGFSELEGLLKLSSLERLEVLRIEHCKKLQKIEGLAELGCLQELFISGCDSLTELEDFRCLTNLRIIELESCKGLKHIDRLGKLQSLQELSISGFDSLKRPGRLRSLEILKVTGCNGIEKINYLENLHALQELFISGCDSLKTLGRLRGLRHLRVMKIDGCKGLRGINDLGKLDSLQELFISGCYSLKSLGGLRCLRHLRVMEIDSCNELEEIDGLHELQSLQELYILGCHSWKKLEPFGRFRCSLKVIKIDGCMGLKEINLDSLDSLQELFISGCDSLRKLCGIWSLHSLRVMKIDSCKGLEGIDDQGKLNNLQELIISGCDSIRRLVRFELPLLRVMKIDSCKGLEEISDMGKLDSLQELFIAGCNSLKRLWSISCLDSLIILKIDECKQLEEIDGLKGSDSLRELFINGCDSLQHLPDLSKSKELRVLHVGSCEKLRDIKGLSRLSSLRDLQIHDCPSLQSIVDELKPMKRSRLRTIRGNQRSQPGKTTPISFPSEKHSEIFPGGHMHLRKKHTEREEKYKEF